jgi:hypothetical protein
MPGGSSRLPPGAPSGCDTAGVSNPTGPGQPGQPQQAGWNQPPPGYQGGPQNYPPGYGPQGFGPGGPPRKRRTGLYVGIALAAALVVVLGITGFISPGFLVNGKTTGGTAPAPSEPGPNESATPGAPRLAEAGALATKFLGYLNVNDQKSAAALGCRETTQLLPGVILLAVDPPTKLTAGTPTGQLMIGVPFTGTTKSNPATGTVIVQDLPPAPLCVRMLQLRLG